MILDDIVRDKKKSLEEVKAAISLSTQMERAKNAPKPRDFKGALSRNGINVIAEVKRASPSKGIIRKDFDAVALAKEYETGGAAAISILTEEKYFLGSLDFLSAIRSVVSLPLLRKDFIFDPYQIYEARANGADALLLIAAVLDDAKLKELLSLTESLGMTALVEAHDKAELERSLKAGGTVIGINNRDLKTFTVDINTTKRLMPLIPDDVIVVSESGISERREIEELRAVGVDAFLIGETLAKEAHPALKLRAIA